VASGGNYGNATGSNTVSLTVNQATPTFSITVNGNSTSATITYGSSATLAESGLPAGATGTVTFYTSTNAVLCSFTYNVSTTSCTTSATLAAGTYSGIHATFVASGGNYGNATGSNTVSLTVNSATTGTTSIDLHPEIPTPVTVGTSVTYTATVTKTSGSGTLTGTVSFSLNGVVVPGCAAVALSAGGVATCTVTFSTAGNITVSSTYGHDPNFSGSSDSSTQVVRKGTTSLSLTPSSPPAVTVGASVIYTATVTETSGSGTLTGTVSFTENGNPIAGCQNLALGAGNKATCSVHFTGAGTFIIAATYANDPNFNGSSDSSTQVVRKGTTSLSLTPSPAPAVTGPTSVIYTATVAETSGSGSLSGKVSFTENGNPIAGCQNLALVSGKATCTVNFTTGGTFTVAATYANDPNFNGSSGSVAQTVNTKPVITSDNSTHARVGRSFSFQVTATGYPAPTFAESGNLPTGVTFNAATGVLSGTPAAGTAGTYTFTIKATNAAGSTTQTFSLTVSSH
jgi:hypothetical protein